MDTTTEAPLQPFPIGPSSIVGRFVVLRVLLCHSLSSLRHRMLHLLSHLFPFLPHPKKPAGILLFILFLFFSLRRSSATRRAARSAYRRRFWRNLMRSALTFDEWQHAARMLEKENMDGKANSSNLSSLYDEDLIRSKILELRLQRVSGNIRDVVFSLRADLVRNLGNMCNPRLHKGRVTVPPLIRDYIDEVSAQLRLICDDESEDFPVEEKLAFMQETRHAFGRTALLLSGGASLGAFHVGVVKALVENKLLPRIIAGSSVGSVMCAIVGTRTWPELQSFFEDSWHSLKFFDQLGGIFTVVKRILNQGAVHEIRQLQKMLRVLTSNLTFQEAYDLTGRIVGITVCSPRPHEPPRCLNYLTSPNVVIWSAVTASCAFPGLFEAQELMAKDRRGELVPYHTSVWITEAESMKIPAAYEVKNRERRWRDGSLESDLPMVQLKELFNVNHFIVSQANPHVAPFLRIKEIVRAYGGDFAAKLAHLLEMEVKHRCNQILYMGFPLGGIAKLFAQDWEGDVTIVMPATLAQYSKIIQNLSHVELQKSANQGRRCTWEKLSAIKANCGIEIVLDECVAYLNHVRRVKRRAAAASKGLVSGPSTVRLNSSRRIPSWNCIARENSSGSLDEESLGEGSQHHQGRNVKINGHEHSDGETDSVDVNVSWTMSGGPLMRTASANLFINFVQSLEFQPELEKVAREAEASSSHGNSDDIETAQFNNQCDTASPNSGNKAAGSCSSITVSERDLLKPERVENRIVLNVVKKEDLLLGNVGSESQPQQFPESVQLDGYNASSASDCGEDDEEGSIDGTNPEQVTISENKNNH